MAKVNRTVLRALKILQLFQSEKKPLTMTEISNILDMPRSSTFDILYTLQSENYIRIENEALKTYTLGLKAFEIGAAYLASIDLTSAARPYLEEIMSKTGATSFLAIENSGELVYLDKVEAPTSVRTTAILGSRKPMYCTGLGKALLAAYDYGKIKDMIEHVEFEKLTHNTIDNKEDLVKEIQNIKSTGYAYDDREGQEMVSCIAAPIYDAQSNPVAAISIATMYTNINSDTKDNYADLITSSALKISKILGYSGDKLY